MDTFNDKIELIMKKLERIELLLTKKQEKTEKIVNETTWSVTDYKKCILISFSFNAEFKDYIKELGGVWMVPKKAWMFAKSNETEIIEQIQKKFPNWEKK
jgi:hypothetical protein